MKTPTNSKTQLTNGSFRVVTRPSTQVGTVDPDRLAPEAVEGLERLVVLDLLAQPVQAAGLARGDDQGLARFLEGSTG